MNNIPKQYQECLKRIIDLMQEKKISQKYLCDKLGISQKSFTEWKAGRGVSYIKKLNEISHILNVSSDYLWKGETDERNPEKEKGSIEIEPNAYFLNNNKVRMIPLFESVSAGLGAYTDEEIQEYIPLYIESSYEANETMCIKVKGDSMFPKIEDGDIIQVHKQTSVDSGSIAVVLLDGEEGLVKKVVYGPTWIELHSINPMYKTMRFDDRDVLRLRVIGKVKKIIKSV